MTDGDPDAENLDKQCLICLQSPRNPSQIDLEQGKSRRPWGLRFGYGPLCLHCKKMTSIRYGFMHTPKLVSWLEGSERNKAEARVFALAWMSLREEGRVHITFAMLEARGNFIRQVLEMSSSLDVARHGMHEYMLLSDYAAAHPQTNPVDDGMVFVQLRVAGQRGLGLQVPVAGEDLGMVCSQWPPPEHVGGPRRRHRRGVGCGPRAVAV